MATASGTVNPAQGEVWEADLDPTVGREQAGRRPVLILSVNAFNSSPRGLVRVAPVTGTVRGLPTHVPIAPPEGGLTKLSVVMVEQSRAISKDRLIRRDGVVTLETMDRVKSILKMIFGLS